MSKPIYVKGKKNRIPIVHAGQYGEYMGRLLVDITKGKPLKVLKYELVPVDATKGEDQRVAEYVKSARQALDRIYGGKWLKTKIGDAKIPLFNSEQVITPWTAFVTDAIRESRNAHISFHAAAMAGTHMPAGPITQEMLYNVYPRNFDIGDRYGWHVYDVKILGVFLKILIKEALKGNFAVGMSGVSFDLIPESKKGEKVEPIAMKYEDIIANKAPRTLTEKDDVTKPALSQHLGRDFKIKNIKVRGLPVKLFRFYYVALPEGFVKGSIGSNSLYKLVLRKRVRTNETIWGAMGRKLIREKEITADYHLRGSKKMIRRHMLLVRPQDGQGDPKALQSVVPRLD